MLALKLEGERENQKFLPEEMSAGFDVIESEGELDAARLKQIRWITENRKCSESSLQMATTTHQRVSEVPLRRRCPGPGSGFLPARDQCFGRASLRDLQERNHKQLEPNNSRFRRAA